MGGLMPVNNGKVCEICRFYIYNQHQVLKLWHCKHEFHLRCIEEYRRVFLVCPVCEKEVLEHRRNNSNSN